MLKLHKLTEVIAKPMSMYHALWFAPSEDDLKKGSELIRSTSF